MEKVLENNFEIEPDVHYDQTFKAYGNSEIDISFCGIRELELRLANLQKQDEHQKKAAEASLDTLMNDSMARREAAADRAELASTMSLTERLLGAAHIEAERRERNIGKVIVASTVEIAA